MDPHYSWITYLQIYLHIKFICNPQINTSVTFALIHRHVQGDEKSESPDTHNKLKQDDTQLVLTL